MKKLSIEEKAKRYDEILARAKCTNIPYYKDDIMSKVKEFVDYLLPELKESESEDGRIRKALKEYFINSFQNNGVAAILGVHIKDILAWLEKQAKHANFRNKIQIGDKVTRNEDGVLVNLSQLNRVAKKDEKQGEQKLNVNDNAKEMFIKALERVEEQNAKGYKLTDCDKNSWWEDFKNYTSCTIEQKPAAWSDEDEQLYNDLSDTYFYNDEEYPEETYKRMLKRVLDWMDKRAKLLRPKQEWSEEDESRIDNLCHFLEEYGNQYYGHLTLQETISWLKSLKERVQPQKTWKPSDEQMDALAEALSLAKNCGEESAFDLGTLHDNLKRLLKI